MGSEKELLGQDKITCPFCLHPHDIDADSYEGFISVWGEDSETEFVCESCDKVIDVYERVERTWDCYGKE